MVASWVFFIVALQEVSSVSAFCGLAQTGITRRSSALFTATFDPAVSSKKGLSEKEVDVSERWLLESLEKEERCVIGPKEVLVYDTTLRGTC